MRKNLLIATMVMGLMSLAAFAGEACCNKCKDSCSAQCCTSCKDDCKCDKGDCCGMGCAKKKKNPSGHHGQKHPWH